jgi:hypothetical protein
MTKLYKYFSSEVFDLIFQRNGFIGLKCSFPKDYNDPYELFLGVDLDVSADILAVYQEIVQELPQLPTTCFSKSPVVAPMWAHYAMNYSGFVLEFDVDALKENFAEASIRDVDYKDAPDGSIVESLERVAVTKKPRHAVWLRQTVLSEAYFSKQTAWSYEQECRLIDFNEYVEDVSGNMILFVPLDCIRSIIFGHKFPMEKLDDSIKLVESRGLRWFKSVIGRTQPAPFLVSEAGQAFQFDGQSIEVANNNCNVCSEPVAEGKDQCPWCSITELDQLEAASGNPFRILDRYGILEGYFESVERIEARRK